MKENWQKALATTLRWEGGYVNNPKDPGGATNYGITARTLAEDYGRPVTLAEVRNLPMQTVERIYHDSYWNKIGGDELPSGVDLIAFDIAVNSGVERAKQWIAQTSNLKASYRVSRLHALRMGFWRRLRTWVTFGHGWSRRELDVLAEARKLAQKG